MKRITLLFLALVLMLNVFALETREPQIEFYPIVNISNHYGTSDFPASFQIGNQFYAVWSEWGDPFFAKSLDAGVTWSQSVNLAEADNIHYMPAVAANGQGQVWSIYQLSNNIMFRYSNNYGESWYTQESILHNSRGIVTPVMSASGDSLMVVFGSRDVNNRYQVHSLTSYNGGQTWNAEVPVTVGSLSIMWPTIEVSGSDVYAVWGVYMSSTNFNDIDMFFSKSSDFGQTWTTPVNLTNSTRGFSRFAIKSIDNNVYIAASTGAAGTTNQNDIKVFKSVNNGDTFSEILFIETPGFSSNPALSILRNEDQTSHRVYLLYEDNSFGDSDIFMTVSLDNGNEWSDPINVSDTEMAATKPKIYAVTQGETDALSFIWKDNSWPNGGEIVGRRAVHYLTPFGNFHGQVTNTAGQPVENATITAGGFQTQTDANGNYSLNVSPAVYNVICTKPGYYINTQYNITISENETSEVNFVLSPQEGEFWPPHNLRGRFVNNAFVQLDWESPIGFNSTELLYDDGGAETYNWTGTATGQEFVAVSFSHNENIYLRRVKAMVNFDQAQDVEFYVFGDVLGQPDVNTVLGGPYVVSLTNDMIAPLWVSFDLDIPLPANVNFYIAAKWNQGNTFLIGSDLDFPAMKSFSTNDNGNNWHLLADRNFMIRAGISVESTTRNVLGYNVYRNNQQLNNEILTGLSYADETAEPNLSYNYHVTAVYNEQESGQSNVVNILIQPPVLLPPFSLTAELVNQESIVLNWRIPGSEGEWKSYDNGEIGQAMGTSSAEIQDAAIRFTVSDLQEYVGDYLTKVSFVPNDDNCTYKIKVWKGGNVGYAGVLVQEKLLSNASLNFGEMNTIDLDMPVLIESNQELWIGFNVVIPAGGGQPYKMDTGPCVASGKSDLVYRGGSWVPMYNSYGFNVNHTIRGFFARGNQRDNVLNNIVSSYNVYRDDILIANVTDTLWTDENLNANIHTYYVTALYGNFESAPTNSVEVVISSVYDIPEIKNSIVLHSNYPNPFNPETTLSFSLADRSVVSLEIFNIKGQRIRTLLDMQTVEKGTHKLVWDGKNDNNKEMPSNMYFYRLSTPEFSETKKMLLIK